MKTISFSILFSILQLFFNPLFFAFLQQFTAGENLKVAGDSAGRRRILTTLPVICNLAVTRDCVQCFTQKATIRTFLKTKRNTTSLSINKEANLSFLSVGKLPMLANIVFHPSAMWLKFFGQATPRWGLNKFVRHKDVKTHFLTSWFSFSIFFG